MKRFIEEIDNNVIQDFNSTIKLPDNNIKLTNIIEETIKERENLIKQIQSIQEHERYIDSKILQEKRIYLPLKSELNYINKVLRLFIRHIYYPIPSDTSITNTTAATTTTNTNTDASFLSPGGTPISATKGYFMLYIEGITFREGSSSYTNGLQNLLDRIYIEVDKGRDYNVFTYEWKENQYPEGSQAQGIIMKIPCDKSCSARIQLYLKNHGGPSHTKYYVKNERLQTILTHLPGYEGTEEEICLGILQYIKSNNLISELDPRYFRCDEVLRDVFGEDSLQFSRIRAKLLSGVLGPALPIQFDHIFSTNNTEETVQSIIKSGLRLPSHLLYPKIGGRVIDLNISVPDESVHRYLYEMNQFIQLELQESLNQRQLISQAQFLARELQEYDLITNELLTIYNDYYDKKRKREEKEKLDNGENSSSGVAESSSFWSSWNPDDQKAKKRRLPLSSLDSSTGFINQFPQPPSLFELIANRNVKSSSSSSNGVSEGGRGEDEEKGVEESSSFRFSHPIHTIDSALHSLGGFLDIGNNDLFDPSQKWLQELEKVLNLESRPSAIVPNATQPMQSIPVSTPSTSINNLGATASSVTNTAAGSVGSGGASFITSGINGLVK